MNRREKLFLVLGGLAIYWLYTNQNAVGSSIQTGIDTTATTVNNWQTQAGIAMDSAKRLAISTIERFEGTRYTVYNDVVGYPTVGVGHKILPSDNLNVGDTISQDQVDSFLYQDAQSVFNAVESLGVQLTDGQYAALCSLCFNIGVGAFKNSTVVKCLLSGDYAGASAHFMDWTKAHVGGVLTVVQGLANRRQGEQQIFNS